MSVTENIVRRLRESRITEAEGNHEYKFRIPWRLQLASDEDTTYQYNPKYMDYLGELVKSATEDFNDANMAQYAARDARTEDSGIKSMTMDFNDEYECIITVISSQILGQDKIDGIIKYLSGQMSDGWGEGFEQRELAKFTNPGEEWIEDEDSDKGGYYEEVDVDVYVYGQFWWADSNLHPYAIELVSTPHDKDKPTNESLEANGEYQSSFEKDIMRTVNDEAPSALHWKDGDIILNKDTNITAEFKGYKKNFTGSLQAIMIAGEEKVIYSLSDLQDDIEKGILVNKSSRIKESGEGYSREELIRIIRTKYKKFYDFSKYSDSQLYKMLNNLESKGMTRREASKDIDDERNRKLENQCEECGRQLSDNGKCRYCDPEIVEESSDVSVEYTYNGDDTSDYKGHIKVRGANSKDHALEIAKDYIEAIRPEDDPRHFEISRDNYNNVDIIDVNGDKINESESSSSFKIGDEVEWSGLYGGSYTGKIKKVTDKEVTLTVSWTAEDTGKLVQKDSTYPIEKDEEGNDVIVVWEYHGHKGYIYPSTSHVNEESDVDMTTNEIRAKIKDAVKKFMMSPRCGFPEDEVDEYSRVDVEYVKDENHGNYVKIEVGAELSFKTISDLCDELNPIVFKYDQDSYFEPEQPGIIVAYLAI